MTGGTIQKKRQQGEQIDAQWRIRKEIREFSAQYTEFEANEEDFDSVYNEVMESERVKTVGPDLLLTNL